MGYDTVSEAVASLQKRGYTYDFQIDENNECLICKAHPASLSPEDFQVDEVYRYEGDSDPGDEAVVYAVSSPKHELKGIVVNSYGVYGDPEKYFLMQRLQVNSISPPPSESIKSYNALVLFSREHHYGLLLCTRIRKGLNKNVSPERITSYVLNFFDGTIRHHLVEEERLLLPKLSENDPIRQQAIKEQSVIYALINVLRNEKATKEVLKQFADELEGHIRFEKRELFKHVKGSLSESELETMNAQNIDTTKDLETDWEDQFWK